MFIQIIFKNNLQVEGNLYSYEDNKMVIKSIDELITTVVPSVSESVSFYQINHAKEKLADASLNGSKTLDDMKDLVEAKIKLNLYEREEVFNNLRNSIYDDTQKQISIKHSSEEVRGANSNFASGLRKMFK